MSYPAEYAVVAATCKFCGVALSVKVAHDFIALCEEPTGVGVCVKMATGGWQNIVKLAACNRCADARIALYNLNHQLDRLAGIAYEAGTNKELAERCEKKFSEYAERYCVVVAQVARGQPVPNDAHYGNYLLVAAQNRLPLWEVLKKLWPKNGAVQKELV